MGAEVFSCSAKGKDANEAFSVARSAALHAHGHNGYTGSIAEKSSFRLVPLHESVIKDKVLFFHKIQSLIDNQFDDKWGPAGCIELKEGEYYFFGWASC